MYKTEYKFNFISQCLKLVIFYQKKISNFNSDLQLLAWQLVVAKRRLAIVLPSWTLRWCDFQSPMLACVPLQEQHEHGRRIFRVLS